MEAYLIDWLNLLARWVHVVTGIAWIGSSLYFIWLDNSLETPRDPADDEKGVGGEVWSVHGGGFYHAQKYKVAPQQLPETLHWFKWEAYWTWISGITLLMLVYYVGAEQYLIDPSVMELSGCDPVFVREDADLDLVTRALRFGMTFNGSFTCIALDISPTSSRNKVPPWAAPKRPSLACTAPLNAPRT